MGGIDNNVEELIVINDVFCVEHYFASERVLREMRHQVPPPGASNVHWGTQLIPVVEMTLYFNTLRYPTCHANRAT